MRLSRVMNAPAPFPTESQIEDLVTTFYARIRKHPTLGPIFEQVIGADWTPHLKVMCDFWSSVMLMSGRYKGNPMIAHMRLKMVRPEHFERWLELFTQTAAEVCPAAAAEAFVGRANNIARSLQLGMFYRAEKYPPPQARQDAP